MKAFIGMSFAVMMLLSGGLSAAEVRNYGKEVEFPLGDHAAGRDVFMKYQCFACHHVKHDASMPLPVSAPETRGPDLSPRADRPLSLMSAQMRTLRAAEGMPEPDYTPEFYAAAIMAPSHSIAPGFGKGSAEDAPESPMKDYSSEMTVREAKDLVAYLTQAPS